MMIMIIIKLVAKLVKIAPTPKAIKIKANGGNPDNGAINILNEAEIPASGEFIYVPINMIYAIKRIGSQPIIVAALRNSKSGVPSVRLTTIMMHTTNAVTPNIPKVEKALYKGPN